MRKSCHGPLLPQCLWAEPRHIRLSAAEGCYRREQHLPRCSWCLEASHFVLVTASLPLNKHREERKKQHAMLQMEWTPQKWDHCSQTAKPTIPVGLISLNHVSCTVHISTLTFWMTGPLRSLFHLKSTYRGQDTIKGDIIGSKKEKVHRFTFILSTNQSQSQTNIGLCEV